MQPRREYHKVVNFSERRTRDKLEATCEKHGAAVNPKVRMADVFKIQNSGLSDKEYSYCLKAHFDFVVTDRETESYLFAVEFDGPGHRSEKQTRRDAIKNRMCELWEFPILRINANYLTDRYRSLDMLSWFVEAWFAYQWFVQAKESGELAYDEPFSTIALAQLAGHDKPFPLVISGMARKRIMDYCVAGRVWDFGPSCWIGRDKNGITRGMAFARVDADRAVLVETAMRAQGFHGLIEGEAVEELVLFQLGERVPEVLTSGEGYTSMADLKARLKHYQSEYQLVMGCLIGDSQHPQLGK